MATYLTIAVLAYLLGSIPFGYLLVRAFRGDDIRESGSGNIGATNVARSAPGLGVLTLVLDAGKGALAVVAAVALAGYFQSGSFSGFSWAPIPAQPAAALAALLAVAGHVFPPWLKFRGGKGVATGAGAFLVLVPKVILAAVAIFLLVVAVFRYVALGSIVAVSVVPLLAFLLRPSGSSPTALAAMCATALLIVARHHENLRRLFAGSEPRFHWRRS